MIVVSDVYVFSFYGMVAFLCVSEQIKGTAKYLNKC